MTDTDSPVVSPEVPSEAPVPARGRRRNARGGARGEARASGRPAGEAAQGRRTGRPGQARAVNPVLERLFELYPAMFGARFRPLKLGVYQELMAAHGDEFKKEDLKLALGQHARSTRYLESVAAGEQRHDLKGVPVEPVAPEHIHHAILEVFRRRQARSKDDQRPWLRARLVDAVQAAGLTREAWDARVGATDDLSVQMLDEAFAELAAKQARREALKRAFEASGRSVAEFAEMYGMEPAVVEQALGARPDAQS